MLVDSSMVGSNDDLVRELRRDGFAVCWNGDCSRARATPAPPTISAAAQALDVLIHALVDDHRLAVEDVAVVAQGPAALAALTWAHDYAPRVRALIVASHGLRRSSHAPLLREFLRDAFEKPWQRPSLIDADQGGFTKETCSG
jgi:hypothetical protein